MNQAEIEFKKCPPCISVPLNNPKKDFITDKDKAERFYFTDYKKFITYVFADFIAELIEKCDAGYLGYCENETITFEALPTAIEIISKAIKLKKYASIKDLLEKTKELMELALELKTFIQFDF